MHRKEPKTCLIPACSKTAKIRGLCSGCFSAYRHAVNKGATTETESIKLGLLLPKSPQFTSEWRRALKVAKEKELEQNANTKTS